MKAIDLFAGAGGFSQGGSEAGCKIVWAANHNPLAVEYHAKNHPDTQHICQDLHQADWSQVPEHDLLLASPCCQGHSKARGKESGNPQHDASRSTAWAVVSAAEMHRPPFILIENVPEFLNWALYPAWEQALQILGYDLTPYVLDAADFGVPQNRVRMFIVGSRNKPLILSLPKRTHQAASTFLDLGKGRWSSIYKKAPKTVARFKKGRADHGDVFLLPYYGNAKGGRSIHRPIGTITTKDRYAIVKGDKMRMISPAECKRAMGFPDDYQLPGERTHAIHLLGNAVCPPQAREIIQAIIEAA